MIQNLMKQPDESALPGTAAPAQGLVKAAMPPMVEATAAQRVQATATAGPSYKLGNKVSPPKLAPTTVALRPTTSGPVTPITTPTKVPPTTATTPTPSTAIPAYTPYALGNNGFTGWGDADYGAANGQYFWLPDNIKQQIQKNQGNKYYLLAGDDSQATTVDKYVDANKRYLISEAVPDKYTGGDTYQFGKDAVYGTRDEALKALGNISDADLEKRATYQLADVRQSGYYSGDGGDPEMTKAEYGSRDDFLKKAGLLGVKGDTSISFSGASAGNGNTYGSLGASATNSAKVGQDTYQSIVDKNYKNMVQIGNQGPLNDDIDKMLGKVYEQVGAKDAAQQELVKNALFKYDPRFGVLGNEEFVKAAAGANNNRVNGWFQKNAGVIAALVSIINPVVGMAISAAGTVANGGGIGDVAKGIAASYAGQYLGTAAGGLVGGALGNSVGNFTGDLISGAVKGGVGTAVGQVIRNGSLDGKQILAGTVAGGLGTAAGGWMVDNTNFGDGLIKGVMDAGNTVGSSLILGKKIDPKALGLNLAGAGAGALLKNTFGKG